MLDVYVPAPGSLAGGMVAPKSGIVGSPAGRRGSVRIDYEGNIHGAANIRTYADRVMHAAGRHRTRYPTVARAEVPESDLVRVGRWDAQRGRVVVEDEGALAGWLGVPLIDPDELRVTAEVRRGWPPYQDRGEQE